MIWTEANDDKAPTPENGRAGTLEYRVVWKREGQQRKRKIYQTRQGAEQWVNILTGVRFAQEGDPPEYGPQWIAGGKWPAFTEEPSIEARPVGIWSPEAPRGSGEAGYGICGCGDHAVLQDGCCPLCLEWNERGWT